MPLRLTSLGLKLNLALLAFFIVLGAATAAFVFVGFDRTRDNAALRSEEALEDLGADVLQYIAYTQADIGAVAMEWAGELGHRASRYMQQFKAAGATAALDTSSFAQTASGVWYNPDPDRVSDVVVLNNAALQGAVLDDITYSAALDALFPALVEGFPGESSGEAYHPIAIIFISANAVGRYYPPIGLHESTPADFDASYLVDKFGPSANPTSETIWTVPYEDLNGRGLVITAQTPVYEGDLFRGLFEVDLSIGNLVEVVNGIKPTDSGFAFYVDREGGILQTDAHDLLITELNSGDNTVLAEIIERMKRGEPGVDRVVLGGQEFFLASGPMRGVGGGFAIVAPISELTADAAAITAEIDDQADRTLLLVLGSMTALFAAALVAGTYLNRRVLVRPIEALVSGTRAVAQGDFETRIAIRGDDELAVLGHSFNQMTADIQREVSQREETQSELQALFSAMTDVVIVFDREGRCLRIAPTNPDLLYAPREEVVGHTLHEIMPEEQAGFFIDHIEGALNEEAARSIEYPLRIQERDFWFTATISPMSTDTVVYVARDITDRVNARQELERQVDERTRELTAILKISNEVASTLELEPLLALVIAQVKTMADYDHCALFTFAGDRFRQLDPVASTNGGSAGMTFRKDDLEPIASRILGKEAIVIDDLLSETDEARAQRRLFGTTADATLSGTRSWMCVPLPLKDRVIGMLALSHRQASFYTERHVGLVGAIASQVAVAIENARLYEQAQQLAAVEERQRLARELHDSVSQALYGIALSATAAQTLMGNEASPARQRVDFVMSQAQAAMAEMRALIFELRPESLAEEGLVAALLKQTDALAARYGFSVVTELAEEPPLGLAEKEAFYRIAQEALHNVVKHAQATEVAVRLTSNGESTVLEIGDNGVGFDTAQRFPGHIGLVSFGERASTIGATVEVQSRPGEGTNVRVSVTPVSSSA
jgi:PAS domain S-box-containing protein